MPFHFAIAQQVLCSNNYMVGDFLYSFFLISEVINAHVSLHISTRICFWLFNAVSVQIK
jgi:hypothetical protein